MTLINNRESNAVSGSEFIQNNINNNRIVRESNALKEFLNGNIPDFLRNFVPIVVSSGGNTITYMVMSDYLSIGSNEDYVRMPLNPLTAQKIADQYDCTLPTRKMVISIWEQSEYKLEPLPWGAPYDESMMSIERIKIHNSRIQEQLHGKDFTKLISGHKKDVVLSNKMYPNNSKKRVTIFGWIQPNGLPIQGMNYWSHEDNYADYSHGIRLIANDVMVNNSPKRIQDVLKDATLSALLCDEGILNFLKY